MMTWLISLVVASHLMASALPQPRVPSGGEGPMLGLSAIVGRPTDRAVTVSVLSATPMDVFVEYGRAPDDFRQSTPVRSMNAGEPMEFEVGGLAANTSYAYRLRTKARGAKAFEAHDAGRFHTQRPPGQPFTFGVQGDSHPERPGKMYDADLYVRTLTQVRRDAPDFYFMMGDDFSIERLIERGNKSQDAVNAIYAHQRGFLGLVGQSTPLMLVNGNHEQAAKYLLDGTANNFAVMAGRARTAFFPLPAPGGIYSGNAEPVEHVGLLRDYYAWEWGDALFVVIDPYWHSDAPVDNEAGVRAPQRDAGRDDAASSKRSGKGDRDLWQITLGDTQYQWLRTTLQESTAQYKFVFSHHVSGTGRGGVEVAGLYEWGGEDRRGIDRFAQMRPRWEKPIHDLLRDTGVTIFFQGHDHLYARQELDGVIYQTVPNPADPTYTAFNRQAYQRGDLLPNSGYLRVTVAPGEAKVEYVRSFRPQDEGEGRVSGSIAHSYVVKPRTAAPVAPASSLEPK